MSKEYTYDIDKYTIGVDTNGEDGIGLTIAIIKNREINFLGNCYGENARCLDLLIKENQELKLELSGYRQAILNNKEMLGLKEQNEELKKQLEEYIKQNMKLKDELFDKRKEYQDTYKDVRIEIKEYKTQQKEFIKYLEDMLDDENDIFSVVRVKDVLQKYKEIIGDINDKK